MDTSAGNSRLPARLVWALLFSAVAFSAHGAPPASGPATLRHQTSEAFQKYVSATDSRNEEELRSGKQLLWIDSLPEGKRKEAYAALARGDVEMQQRHTLEGDQAIVCPGGLIHHWEGVVFIPGAHLDDVLEILQDYAHHATYYAPDVERAKLQSHDGDHFRAFLRFRRKKVITVVLNTEHDIHYFRDSPKQAHSRSSAARIAEVDNAGKSNEREKSHDDDGGYLWGMETWWRMIERDGGVYVQSEVASLTRDIPTALGWMIGPFVTSIPKETLTLTLEATRKAVLGLVVGR